MSLIPDDLEALARQHGTPLIVVDHARIRAAVATFRACFPRFRVFFAVKANPEPPIVRTLYGLGHGFDVASWEEFQLVNGTLPPGVDVSEFVRDRIIYANPVKPPQTLERLDPLAPLVTYDNLAELDKIQRYCPRARLILRVAVPNKRSVVELSSKFGSHPKTAPALVRAATARGLAVEGLSYHVGSQCNNIANFTRAARLAATIFKKVARQQPGARLRTLDVGGGFPAPYRGRSLPLPELAEVLNPLLDSLFPPDVTIIAEPGRYLVAQAATAVASIIGKADRKKRRYYYIDDGVYNTFSGKIYDHQVFTFHSFRDGARLPAAVVGPTCDALDKISLNEQLPDLEVGECLYVRNVGAYTNASASRFNGFPPAKVLHVN